MDRRDLLKYLLQTPLTLTIDYEKLLWIPGEKTIFIPSGRLTELQIVQAELERILPYARALFDMDDAFYSASSENIRIPLTLQPGKYARLH